MFEASSGNASKSANATISVTDIVVENRPMTVKFLELVSPAPGELAVTWFNSFDIDGNHSDIRYHLYISTDKDFYPSDASHVQTVSNTVTTTVTGLTEGATYYVAMLAEDADGKLSKTTDKQEIQLIASKLVLRDDMQVIASSQLPVASTNLTDTQVTIRFTSAQPSLAGSVLQLDRSSDFAFVRLEQAVAISAEEHRYTYTFVEPKDFIQDVEFSSVQGTQDPVTALAQYYQDTGGDLNALVNSRITAAAATDTNSAEYLERLREALLEWAGFADIDELYDFLQQETSINVDQYKQGGFSCGSGEPSLEPMDPLGWNDSFGELEVGVNIKCNLSYTVSLKWNDVLRNEPEHFLALFEGNVNTTFNATGRLQGQFLEAAIDIPRSRQVAVTRMIRVYGPIVIPVVFAINLKGSIQGEGHGELTASWNQGVDAGIRYGIQYSAGRGFSQIYDERFISAVPTDFDGLLSSITNANFTTKFGIELQSKIGPELIVSVFNVAQAYRRNIDGLAIASSYVGPAIAVEVEAQENPEIAIERLNAYPFGIGKYEWHAKYGADIKAKLTWPRVREGEFSFTPFDVAFSRLPDFELQYEDKAIGSNQFEVTAVDQNFLASLTSADLIQSESNWHVFEPEHASINIDTDRMHIDGRWSDAYNGDSTIVFEYMPDTLASLAAGGSELTRPLAKQYKTTEAKFLLEGLWDEKVDMKMEPNLLTFGSCIEQLWVQETLYSYSETNQRYSKLINSYNILSHKTEYPGKFLMGLYVPVELPNGSFVETAPNYDPETCRPPAPTPEESGLPTGPGITPAVGRIVTYPSVVDRYMTHEELKSMLYLGGTLGDPINAGGSVTFNVINRDQFSISIVLSPQTSSYFLYTRKQRPN